MGMNLMLAHDCLSWHMQDLAHDPILHAPLQAPSGSLGSTLNRALRALYGANCQVPQAASEQRPSCWSQPPGPTHTDETVEEVWRLTCMDPTDHDRAAR